MAFFLVSKLGGTGSRKSRKTSQNHPLETLEVLEKVLEWFSKRLCEQALKTLSISSSRNCNPGDDSGDTFQARLHEAGSDAEYSTGPTELPCFWSNVF